MKIKKYILLITLISFSCSQESFEIRRNEDTLFHTKVGDALLPVLVRGNTESKKIILYINGGPGLTCIDVAHADLFNWKNGLEDKFAVAYYDQRGCGNAQGNFNENTLTIAQYIKDLDAIISVLKEKYDDPDIFLMAHSFGAFIGANYLLKDNFQEKIAGWISINGAYNFDFDLSWQYRREFLIDIAIEEINAQRNVEHWQNALIWAEENEEILTRSQKNEWYSIIGPPGGIVLPEEIADISVRDYLSIGFSSPYNPFPAYTSSNLEIVNDRLNEEAEGINLIEEVSGISIPILIMQGRYDDLVVIKETLDVFLNFSTPIEEKYAVIFTLSGHEPYITEPEGFKASITNFVTNIN